MAMTCNILVSRPMKMVLTHAGRWLLFIMLLQVILFCTKPAYLTARTWQFSIDSMIITSDAVPKNARGRGTGNRSIILQVMA